MKTNTVVVCSYCGNTELVDGSEVSGARDKLNFWVCEHCQAGVGCDKKNSRGDLKFNEDDPSEH